METHRYPRTNMWETRGKEVNELDCRELAFCPETDIPWKIPVSNMKQRYQELC